MSSYPLILASASPRRLELLRQSGITPSAVVPADIDESVLSREKPVDYVARLAAEKARVIAEKNMGAIVLAADTTVALGRRVLGKMENEKEERECLELLSGRRHRVISAVSVIAPSGKQRTKAVTSVVKFKRLMRGEIEKYIASGEWKGKAGGYAIQGMAAQFIPFISGSYSNIVGLPMFETLDLLKGAGYE